MRVRSIIAECKGGSHQKCDLKRIKWSKKRKKKVKERQKKRGE